MIRQIKVAAASVSLITRSNLAHVTLLQINVAAASVSLHAVVTSEPDGPQDSLEIGNF